MCCGKELKPKTRIKDKVGLGCGFGVLDADRTSGGNT